MKQALTLFWQERDTRERKMLAVLGVILTVTLMYLLVARPIQSYRDEAAYNLRAAEREHETVISAVARTQTIREEAPESPIQSVAQLHDMVTRSAQDMSVPVARTERSDDGLSLWIDGTSPALLYGWLDTLERKYGVYVTAATIAVIENGAMLRAQISLGYRN